MPYGNASGPCLNQSGAPTNSIERRSVRLDRQDRLDQIGSRVGDRPGKCAGLRMREQDRGTDLFQKRDQCVAVEWLLLVEVCDRRQLAHGELQGCGVIGLTGARPLGVQHRLRPLLELVLRHET
jgi:hypothetical protein